MTDASVPRLHPILEALVRELTHERDGVLAAAARVPASWREAAPAPGRWSGAQVLGHLAKVEASSGKLFSVQARALREADALPEASTDASAVIAAFTARHAVHTREVPIEAPPLVQPEDGVTFDGALAALQASRARLLEAIAKADGLPLGTVQVPHPRLGPLTLYEWLLFIARHEARHAAQLDELTAL
jgi:uncharacterized damage-inducible protein DinB